MMKALLIVSALGGADYEVEMPSMESCLTARTNIAAQNNRIETLCVPKEDEEKKFNSFIHIFEEMIGKLQEMEGRENDDYGFRDSFDRETNSKCRESIGSN